MNIQGHWTGTIIYGKLYKEHTGKELYFDMEIIQHENAISGEAKDTGGVGASPDPAIINGTSTGMKIDFIKHYSRLHYYDKGKTKCYSDLRHSGPSDYLFSFSVTHQSYGRVKDLRLLCTFFFHCFGYILAVCFG